VRLPLSNNSEKIDPRGSIVVGRWPVHVDNQGITMGRGGLSNFSRFASRQALWRGNGSRAIEPQPEQPAYTAADLKWLAQNHKTQAKSTPYTVCRTDRPDARAINKRGSMKVLPSRTVPQPRNEIAGRAVTGTKPISKSPDPMIGETAGANPGKHASAPILADLGKLHPEQRSEIIRVANSK